MTGRRWIILTIATVSISVGVVAAIAFALDPYGVWRDPTGRKLAIYFEQRKAKRLMSRRYVPANFNGLIVGPSVSANWDVPTLAGARMFNESLDGANAAEEQIVVNQALSRGHFKLAVIILNPNMTSSHDVKEGLDNVRVTEAIGSFHLFVHEAAIVLLAAHVRFRKSNAAPDGQDIFTNSKDLSIPKSSGDEAFPIDPVALEQYRGMVQSLRNNGAAIVYVVSPTYEPCYRLAKTRLLAYIQTIRPLLPPAPVIDLDSPEYSPLRSDPENYFDCYHLEPQGTVKVVALLDTLVPQAIASGN
ncbi:MAG: hypothetical protein WA869_06160 [Alloacidobacterium sp.]|jgi:hypothetical protein